MSTPAVFFDAFTEIGPRHRKHLAHAWKLEELIAELDHCSISGALVASTLSTLYDPMHSNLELSRALQKHEHLFPIWNVMPNATGEFPPPDKLARLMRQHDVRAISVHPKANAWDWFADHSVELFRFLERRRILTIVPKEEIGDYSALDQFLSKFKRLRVLLVRAFWTEQRYLLPLLRKHRNLHIGFDHFQIHYGLEELTAAGLEDQLLFTSDAPQMSAGAHRCYVDYADIPEKARAKIAGGNLARLLGMKMPRERVNKNEDTIMRAARHGRPLPCPVVDMHMHILNEGLHGAGGSHRMHRGGPKGVFNLLKRLNVIGGGFMSWNVVSGDSLAGNKTVTDTLDAAP
ncbi:MAG TPA: amidohydrolase family protein, partial [Planctomycetota bacterium]|nr:amidohydrolase family protein [Planctomycetota bacterium]